MLTQKQYELLSFIDVHVRETGTSPSFEEMKSALNLKSKSGIHRLISALEERGFLRRHHHRARALEVVRVPEVQSSALKRPAPPLGPNVVRADFTPKAPPPRANDGGAVQLPLYGRIAAGLPIEALRNESAQIDVPASMLGNGEHYALEVAGDSMVDAGIVDGDTVLIRRADRAENGQIVVALIDEEEVTLKRLRKRGNSIALEPANQSYEVRILPAERVKVQGLLVGLMRKY